MQPYRSMKFLLVNRKYPQVCRFLFRTCNMLHGKLSGVLFFLLELLFSWIMLHHVRVVAWSDSVVNIINSFKVAITEVCSKFSSRESGPIVTLECVIVQLFIKNKSIQSSIRQSSMRHYKSWEPYRNILFFGIYCFLVLLSLILLQFNVG